ncbi:MAG: molybdenum cofactor guanylyltransferase [Acidimicrobiia bacterium]|nr:molybdenum cofactor guanylyltransferase [Acidimicrobiia bacterium]
MTLGAILAGGLSSRMGTDKAFVEVAGRPMVEWVSETLAAVTNRVVIVGRSDLDGFDALPDPVQGPAGPLAGVVAALAEATASRSTGVLVVAVDQPFVRAVTLGRLVGLFEEVAVVPVADGIRQVTCAVYPAAWHVEALAELQGGGSIQSLLDRMAPRLVMSDEWTEWGEDGASWFSVDDANALETGRERFGSVLE